MNLFASRTAASFTSSYSTATLRRALSLTSHLTSNIMTPKPITTAAALIIGDEVLNGKIKDTNSTYFARFCFRNNIELRRIAVVPDDEADIVETLQRLASKYDFIVTSGGIGPTHDDITYEAIAKAFGVPVALDQELADRMHRLGSRIDPANKEAYEAQLRMAIIPAADASKGVTVETIYVEEGLWVPSVSVNSQVFVLPGIPQLFERMLEGLFPHIEKRLSTDQPLRHYVATQLRESEIAHYLTQKQKEVNARGIKLGSYPHISYGINTVSIIGKQSDEQFLKDLVKDVEKNVDGREISKEQEAEYSS